MNDFTYPLKVTLILLLHVLPFCLAYRNGARSESCFGHEVDHSIPGFPPIFKQDCTGDCKFDLMLLGKVTPSTLEVIDANAKFFECDSVYKCKLKIS